jgi:hypothetical protein
MLRHFAVKANATGSASGATTAMPGLPAVRVCGSGGLQRFMV